MSKYPKRKKAELPDFPTWAALLEESVTVPGVIDECYKAFHDYSVGNQMLALWQCRIKKIQPGPMGTYNFWKLMGRQVVSGPGSAIYLWQPISWTTTEKDENGEDKKVTKTTFKYEPHWFVLAQTEGEDYVAPELPGWELGNALWNLEIEPVPFEDTNGNCMGYATESKFAINPLGKHQAATTFHELAHIVLGHTEEGTITDKANRTPTNIRELEAEATALICMDQLGEKDHKQSRGYIQSWYKDNEVPEDSAKRIFSAATKILKAGRK